MRPRPSRAEVAARTTAAIARKRTGGPAPTYRGRAGLWQFGMGPMPGLQDIPLPRIAEDDLGTGLATFCDAQRHGVLAPAGLIYHIPNGGARSAITGANLKRQGTRAGMPDYHLPVARGGFHGLFLELKAADGEVSEKQAGLLLALSKEGHAVCVAFGIDAAIEAVTSYLRLAAPPHP